jgi:nucleotide-binding universal stress UspA family protein
MMRLFTVTNGCEATWPAIEYAARLGQLWNAEVVLVGVTEASDRRHPVEAMVVRAGTFFRDLGLAHRFERAEGVAENVLAGLPLGEDDLIVLGPFGRSPLRRWLFGRSFRNIMEKVQAPLLYVPRPHAPPGKILVCFGGLGYTLTAEHLALKLAGAAGAPVTLLHVVPPIDLDYPTSRDVQQNWAHLLETDSLPARTLREALELAQQEGVEAEVRVRHGEVIEEILAEVREGNYDLLCMGSPYSAHSLRNLYTPNVTAEVAESAGCPILVVRYHATPDR